MAVAGERRRILPLKEIRTGRPTPLANAATGIPPVITVDITRPVSMIPVIVLNRFIFFWQFFHKLQANMLHFQLIFLS